jgi:hypothetical protein
MSGAFCITFDDSVPSFTLCTQRYPTSLKALVIFRCTTLLHKGPHHHRSSRKYYRAPLPWVPLPRPDRYLGEPSFNPIRFTVRRHLGVRLIDIYERMVRLDGAGWQLFAQSRWRTTKLQLYVRLSVLALLCMLTPFS